MKQNEKEPKRIRGTAAIYDDGAVDFRPHQPGEPVKEVLERQGDASLYRTRGREPKTVAHLVVPASAADPGALLQEQLDQFLSSFGGAKEPPVRGRVLEDDGPLRVTCNATRGEVTAQITLGFSDQQSLEQQFMNQFQRIFQCLTINRTYLANVSRAQAKRLHS